MSSALLLFPSGAGVAIGVGAVGVAPISCGVATGAGAVSTTGVDIAQTSQHHMVVHLHLLQTSLLLLQVQLLLVS